MKTEICGVKLSNPTILASGILGVNASSLVRAGELGAGAVTKKSIGLSEKPGHKNPTMVEVTGGYLNCMGLPTPSLEESLTELEEYKKLSKVPIIASFYGKTEAEFAKVAKRIGKRADLLEANMSCPNVRAEHGVPFASRVETARLCMKEIKEASNLPVIVKLTPNVPDIGKIAKALVEAGADGICAINTVGPGMAIDIKTRCPILSNKTGGLSGACIKPVMLASVYSIYEETEGKVPIIATGGITNGTDAVEAVMAGASAVGIGTAVRSRGPGIFREISDEIDEIATIEGIKSIDAMRGLAHND